MIENETVVSVLRSRMICWPLVCLKKKGNIHKFALENIHFHCGNNRDNIRNQFCHSFKKVNSMNYFKVPLDKYFIIKPVIQLQIPPYIK